MFTLLIKCNIVLYCLYNIFWSNAKSHSTQWVTGSNYIQHIFTHARIKEQKKRHKKRGLAHIVSYLQHYWASGGVIITCWQSKSNQGCQWRYCTPFMCVHIPNWCAQLYTTGQGSPWVCQLAYPLGSQVCNTVVYDSLKVQYRI